MINLMRTIIIGDIHGCARSLQALTELVDPRPERDELVLLGDLFDRGPDSYYVYHMVRDLAVEFGDRFTLLRGNHEDYLLRDKLSLREKLMWDRVGRGATVKSFRAHDARMESAIPWLRENCRLFWRGEKAQCVHAGLTKEPIEDNDPVTLIHDHGVTLQNRYHGRLTVVGHIALDTPTYFAGDGRTTEKLPWGVQRPLPESGVLCVDTGCGKGGRLTAMVIEGDRYTLESVAQA